MTVRAVIILAVVDALAAAVDLLDRANFLAA
jgi:hypothetical protein